MSKYTDWFYCSMGDGWPNGTCSITTRYAALIHGRPRRVIRNGDWWRLAARVGADGGALFAFNTDLSVRWSATVDCAKTESDECAVWRTRRRHATTFMQSLAARQTTNGAQLQQQLGAVISNIRWSKTAASHPSFTQSPRRVVYGAVRLRPVVCLRPFWNNK